MKDHLQAVAPSPGRQLMCGKGLGSGLPAFARRADAQPQQHLLANPEALVLLDEIFTLPAPEAVLDVACLGLLGRLHGFHGSQRSHSFGEG